MSLEYVTDMGSLVGLLKYVTDFQKIMSDSRNRQNEKYVTKSYTLIICPNICNFSDGKHKKIISKH